MKQEDQIKLLKAYLELNGSFKKKCVFHIGASAGFFSEYNMMLLGMLYCLIHHIKFTLYSADANFAYDKGWSDYFQPFCEEEGGVLNKYFNQRPVGDWKTTWRLFRKQRSMNLLTRKLKRYFINLILLVYKRYKHVDYYMQDIWPQLLLLKANGRYRIPELGIDGNLTDALQKLAELTWNFNVETSAEVEAITASIVLPDTYAGCQIRGGDKFIESDLLPVDIYISAFSQHPEVKDVFVLTDDYRIMEKLEKSYGQYHWFSLCQESEQGYYHTAFVQNDKDYLRKRMIRFFASMDILTRASLYIGTRTSNPSVFLFMYMPEVCWEADGTKRLLEGSTLGIN
ncbi:MAG: hypothetical protein LKI39_07410 [Bacteroides sp.]|nr:hypothetical protein [Bacteroides sp.]